MSFIAHLLGGAIDGLDQVCQVFGLKIWAMQIYQSGVVLNPGDAAVVIEGNGDVHAITDIGPDGVGEQTATCAVYAATSLAPENADLFVQLQKRYAESQKSLIHD